MRFAAALLILVAAIPAWSIAQPVGAEAGAAGSFRWSRGQLLSTETAELAEPLFDDGRRMTRVVTLRQWDCAGRRQRVVSRIIYAADGQFVRSERKREPWSAADAESGALRAACQTKIPGARRAKPVAEIDAERPSLGLVF